MNTGPGQGARGPSSLPNWWPADPRHTSSTTSDVMSQLCRVCGEPAAGFHFGAFTCEGCKSFFGRTYNNLSSISECKNNGECVINKKNRTSCKACRLRKCLVVGMSKSGSRYGRRSNWFKIHCLLQEQHQQHHQQQHVQQHQHQQQHHVQQHVQPVGLLGMGLQQQFQQHRQHVQHQQQRSAAAGRPSFEPGPPPPPPPLLPWADVKHHLRLDADNNNSVAGDLNKDGGRLSAAAVVAQAVRPDVLRWPSPFFPAFPFPSAAPFFLAMQPQALHRALRSPGSPPPGSSTVPAAAAAENEDDQDDDQDDDDQDDDQDDQDDDQDDGPLSDERVPFRRGSLPPVQESPMDLSVSASSPPRPRPPSPRVADGPRPTDRCCLRRQRRRRRRRRRRREPSDGRRTSDACADAAARGVTSAGSTGSESEDGPGARPPKNAPLDLTCDRSS